MPVTMYGFKGCDTVKKARAWLDGQAVDYEFFDYRLRPLDPGLVDRWFASAGFDAVLNRNSTTFREMPDAARQGIDAAKARGLILANTNLIKRPVLEVGAKVTTGFRPSAWEALLPAMRG